MKKKLDVKTYSQQWDFYREYHYLFYAGEELVGTCYVIDDGSDEYEYRLNGVYIQDEHRGKGYGKSILNYIKKQYDKLYLNVRYDNHIAIKLYEKNGFETYSYTDGNRYKWMKNFKDE